MFVSSNAFENNGMIPRKYTGFGEDVSPEFIITDVPENTESFAIILDDLDVPFRKGFTHWIIWNIPVTEVIPEYSLYRYILILRGGLLWLLNHS